LNFPSRILAGIFLFLCLLTTTENAIASTASQNAVLNVSVVVLDTCTASPALENGKISLALSGNCAAEQIASSLDKPRYILAPTDIKRISEATTAIEQAHITKIQTTATETVCVIDM